MDMKNIILKAYEMAVIGEGEGRPPSVTSIMKCIAIVDEQIKLSDKQIVDILQIENMSYTLDNKIENTASNGFW